MRKIDIDYYCLPTTEKKDISFFKKNASRKDIKELLFFDIHKQKFINENEEIVNIEGKLILVKSTTELAHVLMERVESSGAKIVVLMTIGELQDNIEIYEEILGDKFLVKTLHKEMNLIYNVRELITESGKHKFLRDTRGHGVRLHFRDVEIPIIVCRP